MHDGLWLKDFLVFLVAAGLIVPLFHRARIGAVLAFLVIGIAVGPHGLGSLTGDFPWIRHLTIEDRQRVTPFAELGVMFLLFIVGLELSASRLWALRRLVVGVGGVQFALSALAIGAAVTFLSGGGTPAVVLGLCLAMSSTAIVMQLLEEQGRTVTPLGQVALSILLFQDLMVAPVLVATEVLGRGGTNLWFALGSALGQAVVAVAVLAGAGYFVLRPLFHIAGRTGSRELIMAMALLIVVVMAVATDRLGLSAALGAFLAGVLLSETEYRHQIEIDLAPVKGLLLGLFFITVGMTIDVQAAWAQIGLILALAAILLLLKTLVLLVACGVFRVARPVTAEASILLAQAGEFAFIVVALAAAKGVLPAPLALLATVVAGLTMMATPLLALVGRGLGRVLQRSANGEHSPEAETAQMSDHVVIGGYGRVGQAIARLLAAENVPFIALDTDGQAVAEQRKRGGRVYFGDAARPEMLERVGASRARAFVVTVNAPRAAERMVAAAHRQRPKAPVLARAKDAAHAARLLKLGAVGVIPEAVEASLQLGGRVLEALGVPDEAVASRLAEERAHEMGRLEQPA